MFVCLFLLFVCPSCFPLFLPEEKGEKGCRDTFLVYFWDRKSYRDLGYDNVFVSMATGYCFVSSRCCCFLHTLAWSQRFLDGSSGFAKCLSAFLKDALVFSRS